MTDSLPGLARPQVSLADIEAADRLIDGVVRRTLVEHQRALSERVGGPVYLKCENLQRAGSFKIRGAYTRMARLSEAEQARGVVAASAGNHAQGVALAAQLLGMRAKVFMPVGAALPKLEATRGYGADVEQIGVTIDEALVAARQYADATGAALIHPFDHPDIVAGQGSVGLEVLRQVPDVKTVLVCTGGGGLLAGVATAIKSTRPGVRVLGVQAQQAAAWPASLAARHPVALDKMATMADGIAVGRPGDVPFALVERYVDDILTVSEDSIARALLFLLERAKLVVEPAGAVGVAALLDDEAVGAEGVEPPVVAILSGGNVDPLLLMRVIRFGMSAAGRYLQFHIRVKDRPGSLARLLAVLAEAGANVLEVEHVRTGPRLRVDEVEIGLRLEMEGPAHCRDVLARLRAEGYPLTV